MKILWLKSNVLHPLDSGGKLRTYNMLRHISDVHPVTYLTLGSPGPEERERAGEYCDRLVTVPWARPPERGSLAFVLEAAKNLVSSMPLSLARYDSSAMRRTARELCSAEGFDVVVSDFLTTAPAAVSLTEVPTVLFQHNVEAVIWERMAESAAGIVRPYYSLQAGRMRDWEGRLVRQFDLVIGVSEEDVETMRTRYGVGTVEEVPTGVDTSYFGSLSSEPEGPVVVFVGSLDWLPNIDGLEWFSGEIWPRIKADVPNARFRVVGRRPSSELKETLNSLKGVEVFPDVPDIRPYLGEAAVVVVPLRVGSGTRLKIYEALAADRAVVSTTVGAEGLPLRHGEHILLADTPDEFARSVIHLLGNAARRRDLASSGSRYVRENFGWDKVSEKFVDLCRRAVDRYQRRAGVA